ncbi:hypothetical protein MITS9504_00196 [Synechococcus sp. MIT S9504]|nr:hypothetical protein MITS9504_00196 [Synechococcus sp. MIT S9504]
MRIEPLQLNQQHPESAQESSLSDPTKIFSDTDQPISPADQSLRSMAVISGNGQERILQPSANNSLRNHSSVEQGDAGQ